MRTEEVIEQNYGQQKRPQCCKWGARRKSSKSWPLPEVFPDERHFRTRGFGLAESGLIFARSSITRRAFVSQAALNPRCLRIELLPMWQPFYQLDLEQHNGSKEDINVSPTFSPWEVHKFQVQIGNSEWVQHWFGAFPWGFSYATLA